MDISQSQDRQNLKLDLIQGPKGAKQLGQLLDRAFPVPKEAHFFDDFPIWNSEIFDNPPKILRVGAYLGDQLASCACARLAEMKTSTGIIPVALVGAVATDPDWRGSGLASKCVASVMTWARSSGAFLAVLWGSEHQMYASQGFELCGQQVRVPLRTLQFTSEISSEIKEEWTPALMNLLQAREGGLVIRADDERWIGKHRNVRWFWTGDVKHPSAYAALGRGIDLPHLVHEWGGEKKALTDIFQYLKTFYPRSEILGSPYLFRQNNIAFLDESIESLCRAVILDRKKLPVLPSPFWFWGIDGV